MKIKYMSLQIKRNLEKGVVANKCYGKIIQVGYIQNERKEDLIMVTVAFYFNKAARDVDINNYVEARGFVTNDLTMEARADQYTFLKTLPDFQSAIDV